MHPRKHLSLHSPASARSSGGVWRLSKDYGSYTIALQGLYGRSNTLVGTAFYIHKIKMAKHKLFQHLQWAPFTSAEHVHHREADGRGSRTSMESSSSSRFCRPGSPRMSRSTWPGCLFNILTILAILTILTTLTVLTTLRIQRTHLALLRIVTCWREARGEPCLSSRSLWPSFRCSLLILNLIFMIGGGLRMFFDCYSCDVLREFRARTCWSSRSVWRCFRWRLLIKGRLWLGSQGCLLSIHGSIQGASDSRQDFDYN